MKLKIAILLLILSLIAGWFYWFEWRPEKELEKCIAEVTEKAKENWNDHCERLKRGEDCGQQKTNSNPGCRVEQNLCSVGAKKLEEL